MTNIEKILEMILDGNQSDVNEAFKELKKLKGSRTIKKIIEPLMKAASEHYNFNKRIDAIYALGDLAAKNAVDLLIEILRVGASPKDASAALHDLTAHGPFLMSTRSRKIQTELPKVREAAAVALGLIGEKKAMQSLIDTLQNDWAYPARAAAAFSLGEMDDRFAIPVLKVAKETEEDEIVLEQVQKALDKLK